MAGLGLQATDDSALRWDYCKMLHANVFNRVHQHLHLFTAQMNFRKLELGQSLNQCFVDNQLLQLLLCLHVLRSRPLTLVALDSHQSYSCGDVHAQVIRAAASQ